MSSNTAHGTVSALLERARAGRDEHIDARPGAPEGHALQGGAPEVGAIGTNELVATGRWK